MRLCLASGLRFATPDELWAVLSPEQWQQWARFAAVEPFGGIAIGNATAWSGNLIAAMHGVELPIDEALGRLGYVTSVTGPPRQLTLEEERAQCNALAASRR